MSAGSGLLAGIASLASPVVARVLMALGMSVVTTTGATIALTTLKDLVLSHLSGGPLAGLQLAGLAGTWVALGAVFGAMTFTASLWGLTKATRLAFNPR